MISLKYGFNVTFFFLSMGECFLLFMKKFRIKTGITKIKLLCFKTHPDNKRKKCNQILKQKNIQTFSILYKNVFCKSELDYVYAFLW